MHDLAVHFDAPIHQGLAGPHGDLPEVEIDALFLQCSMHKIPVTDGSAADRHQNVDAALQAVCYCPFDFGRIIRNDPFIMWRSAGSPYYLGDSNAVRCNNLVFSGCFPRRNQFIAGRNDCYFGLLKHVDFRIATGRCQRQGCSIQRPPARNDDVIG
ncbi:hypothetical protein D3C80_1634450 [compost metagenome]